MLIRAAARTDVGRKRDHNEDAFGLFPDDALFVVADGVGGHKGGEVASALAVEVIHGVIADDGDEDLTPITDAQGNSTVAGRRLMVAFLQANERVLDKGSSDPQLNNMGAAVVSLMWDAAHQVVVICHVGDARAYRIRGDEIEQVTVDHTVVQQLLKDGAITPDQIATSPHRHVLTQAVGTQQIVRPALRVERPRPGDVYVLCSDGVHDLLEKSDILEVVRHLDGDLESGCARIIDLANDRGGHDNITVLVAVCEGALDAAAPPPARPAPIAPPPPVRHEPRPPASPPPPAPRPEVASRPSQTWIVASIGGMVAVALLIGVLLWPSPPPRVEAPPPVATPRPVPLAWGDVSPPATEASVKVGEPMHFGASLAGAHTDAAYRWLVDGHEQGRTAAWDFMPGAEAAGTTREIRVVASAGGQTLERTWRVAVLPPSPPVEVAIAKPVPEPHASLPPRILEQTPPGGKALAVQEGTEVEFSVRVEPGAPEGELSYAWFLDDREVGRTRAWTLKAVAEALAPGNHAVAVEVSDRAGMKAPRASWSVDVTAAVPRLVDFQPKASAVSLEVGKSQEFRAGAGATEHAGDVRYQWTVDGVVSPASQAGQFQLPTTLAAGSHAVEVAAIDARGTRSAPHRWTVAVRPAGTPATSAALGAKSPTPAASDAVTEQDARDWLARYRAAWDKRDAAALRALGVLDGDVQEQKLAEAFTRDRLTIAISNETVKLDGKRAIVAFDRTQAGGIGGTSLPPQTCQLEKGPHGVVATGRCSSAAK